MSTDPSFNSVIQTQGGMPHLLDLLRTEYQQFMAGENEKRCKNGLPPLNAEGTLAAAAPFLRFCEQYLRNNRPVQAFAIDQNYGILLSNNLRFAISPGTPSLQGTMEETTSVPISVGMGQGSVGI